VYSVPASPGRIGKVIRFAILSVQLAAPKSQQLQAGSRELMLTEPDVAAGHVVARPKKLHPRKNLLTETTGDGLNVVTESVCRCESKKDDFGARGRTNWVYNRCRFDSRTSQFVSCQTESPA
jgi:hypothetical protein